MRGASARQLGQRSEPRTATPLAWRLLYLCCFAIVAWSFHTTRAATSQIASEVHAMSGRLNSDLKGVKESIQLLVAAASMAAR